MINCLKNNNDDHNLRNSLFPHKALVLTLDLTFGPVLSSAAVFVF